MGRKVNYFESQIPTIDGTVLNELVEFNTRLAALAINALETRKSRSFWDNEASFMLAYNEICKQQVAMLMGAKEDIIREVREARGPLAPGTGSDLDTFPVGTYPGYNLGDIATRIGDGTVNLQQLLIDANTELDNIATILQAQGAGEDGQLDALLQIVALLSV